VLGASALPASGHVAAFWLLDLLANGATLDEVATAAAGIKLAHDTTQTFLDWAPIQAALDFAIESKQR
jgi:hypothetical protein